LKSSATPRRTVNRLRRPENSGVIPEAGAADVYGIRCQANRSASRAPSPRARVRATPSARERLAATMKNSATPSTKSAAPTAHTAVGRLFTDETASSTPPTAANQNGSESTSEASSRADGSSRVIPDSGAPDRGTRTAIRVRRSRVIPDHWRRRPIREIERVLAIWPRWERFSAQGGKHDVRGQRDHKNEGRLPPAQAR
jgi:Ni/Co efflux regulator RcnB